ncbi:MAG: DUF1028 domain-containing protein [Bacillota bacterium]|nr:DUF1028 domain-containing protein [Bacillota bacterium]
MSRVMTVVFLACAFLWYMCGTALADGFVPYVPSPEPTDATWSIVAYDPATREIGVIVTTRRPAVGNRCPWAVSGVGAVSTQASTNPHLAFRVLDCLSRGYDAKTALDHVVGEDLDMQARQIIVVDHWGNVAAFTGTKPQDFKLHHLGKNFAAAGNILASRAVIENTAATFEKSTGALAYRLLAAMDAGQAAGGDSRGKQSAALKVVKPGWMPYIDVRVDDHPEPLVELRRQLDIWSAVVKATTSLAPQMGYRYVSLNQRGTDVQDMQVMLRDLGFYSGAVDGYFGDDTETAVRAFQEKQKLVVDGIAGPKTVAVLAEAWNALLKK